MKEIPLKHGKVALVDDEDFERVSKFKWGYTKNGSNEYVRRTTQVINKIGGDRVYLHHEVFGKGFIDHKNGNGLDNRKENLRFATRSQNNCNRRKLDKNIPKGVYFCKASKKPVYIAQIKFNKKHYYLGRFKTAEEAHEAYKKKAIELHGEFAKW